MSASASPQTVVRALPWPVDALFAPAPGRQLRWSPAWDCSDDAVLFDAASGDYWILTAQARAIVERLQRDGPLPRMAWPQAMGAAGGIDAMLASLVRGGVLRACQNGRALSPPPADDLD